MQCGFPKKKQTRKQQAEARQKATACRCFFLVAGFIGLSLDRYRIFVVIVTINMCARR